MATRERGPSGPRRPQKSGAPARGRSAGPSGKPGGKNAGGRGAPRGKGPRGPVVDEPPPPRRVGGARNAHGTRIARRVSCARCGKADHIAHPPRDLSRALCRACATEVLRVFEESVQTRPTTRAAKCILCDTPFALPTHIPVDDALCKDCLRGFSVWQGAVETDFERRREGEVRRTGVRLRRPLDGNEKGGGAE